MQDRFVKIMLVVVVGLLAANLIQSNNSNVVQIPSLLNSAHAQDSRQMPEIPRKYELKSVKGFSVEDIQDVVAVGDGHSFVVSNPNGFMVYQLLPSR